VEDDRPADLVAQGKSLIDGRRDLPGIEVGRDHLVPGRLEPRSGG
jgi:hypothetical protein